MPNNRRMGGGGGGPQRGGRGFSQPFHGGGVSPWQGNVSSNMNQGAGLLSQLGSSPQQLALALTSLLSQQQPVNNPPSLLSLNTSPAFSNQPNRFGGNRGREMRRHEPYNKNRQNSGGWRTDSRNNNRNKNQQQGGNRNQQNKGRNQQNQQNKGKNEQAKNKPANKPAEKNKEKKEAKDKDALDTIDLSMDEEERESKRDWKDEKNQSGEGRDDESDNKEGKFHGVPVKFLNCFVCNKEMWDGESMDKHLRGRAHKEMFKALEESIHITVNILRENMRLSEERKMIEWNRLHRLKKNYHKFNDFESNCNMCDLKFMGKITTHRKTEGHQRLKHYLHPKCAICQKEFPSRLDWIEHRLTPDHLRKLAEDMKDQLGGADGAEIIQGDEDDLDIEPLLEEPLQLESEKPILELDDQLDGLQNFVPAYKADRPVATKNLRPFNGFLCELCQRSFPDELIAKEHLKTKRHYTEFVGKIKEIYLRREKDKKDMDKQKTEEPQEKTEEEPEENVQNETEDQEMYDPEAVTNDEEDGEPQEEQEANEEEEEEGDATLKQEDVNGEEAAPPADDAVADEPVKMEEGEPEEEQQQQQQQQLEEEGDGGAGGDGDAAVEEEAEPEVKPEVKPGVKQEPPKTPAARPSPLRRGVKNGAGPKSKKATPATAAEPKQGPGYRIPKVGKPAPASKKK